MPMKTDPRRSVCGRGFCFSIAVFALSSAAAGAQCSQAARPVPASPQPATTAQAAAPSGAATASSSSSAADPNSVRFVTGNAITVLENTPLQVINNIPISSRSTRAGDKIAFTVTRDVVVDGVLVIPCGATVFGTVVSAKQAGRLAGASNLTLELSSLNLDGRSYDLYTAPFKVVGQSKTRPTISKATAGAAVGALAMDVRMATADMHLTKPLTPGQRAINDGIGAGVGAGAGTAISASSPPSIALIPAESEIEFTLASPIAVYPVDQPTAARLAKGMSPGGPVLYIRGESQ